MPSAELRRLLKLHLVDQSLNEIRKRAAALDPGKKTAAEVRELEEQIRGASASKLQSEQAELELQQKTIDEKLKRYDKELYGGKVVNPREVETIEKEVGNLKKQRGDLDERILSIWEELPRAKEELETFEKILSEKKHRLAQEHKTALQAKAQLESEYKQKASERPALAKEISPTLLARYESIRQKHAGVGIGEVDVRKRVCGACGTSLPTRTIEALKEDRIVTCESCHRILYYTEGAI